MNFLKGDKIYLRALEPEDLDVLYKWENDPSLWIHGNTLSPYSKLMLREYINNAISSDLFQSRQLRLMICISDNNETIGTIDLYEIDPKHHRAGVGIFIDESHRGNNYASQVLELLQNYAFHFLHLHQLFAYISCENKISINLFKKQGYVKAGILKDWIGKTQEQYEDIMLMQLIFDNKL